MLLTRLQTRRFFAMFDRLISYANEKLGAVDAAQLGLQGASGVDADAQALVASRLWQSPAIIGEYVAENPDGLSDGECSTISLWASGLTDTFLVDFFPDGEVRFISSGYAFEVAGLSGEVAGMLRELPAAVQTTLLPFDGRIVYAGYLNPCVIDFGEGMLDLFEEEIEGIYGEGRIVRDAEALLQIAQEAQGGAPACDAKEALADLVHGAHRHAHGDGCGCGHDHGHDHGDFDEDFDEDFDPADFEQHVGQLAGLDFEERERAVERYMSETDASLAGRLVELLDDLTVPGPIVHSLGALLEKDHAHDVRALAKAMGIEGARKLDADQLTEQIIERMAVGGVLQDLVNAQLGFRIQALRELAERGGTWEVADDDVVSLRDLPRRNPGLAYVFHEDGVFTFVMPDETLAAARDVDWDAALEGARKYRELIGFFDKLSELRGIVPLADAVAEYKRCCPDGEKDDVQIMAHLVNAIVEDLANYDLLDADENGVFLLHYELMWAYEDEMGLERDLDSVVPMTSGELGEMLEGLLAMQESHEPRPLTPEMLEARSLFDWKIRQQPVRAFCAYLDEHVPAIRDDYYFADKVIEELVDDAKWGLVEQGAAQSLFDILEGNDFICDKDQIQEVLDLWSDFCNGLPVWPNNGWAPCELV